MKHIISWSGGKDSTATVILAHEHNEPVDEIIFCEVMFDENISGELPEHIDFIKNKAIPQREEWGYKVTIVKGKQTYMSIFDHYPQKGKRAGLGLKAGFPMAKRCAIQRSCKLDPIHKYVKTLGEVTTYIGIAIDEPKRLERITGDKVSLLAKYNMTEQDAYELCEKYDLLSPIYEFAPRGGCWFCPNARLPELKHLRNNHKDLWDILMELEEQPNLIGNIWNTLTKKSLHHMEEVIELEENQVTINDLLRKEE